jgi:anaerobic C4-dicarboxylate transporter DcuA
MQVAGGLDYLVIKLKNCCVHPKYITFLAPLVTWFMTIFAGTGNISGNAAGYY